ncbi:MAG: sigma-70 family RNA polymerase sigma factor [Planctomycetota bacterium]|nr:MAG: sigma-70 family RNA polymerase sigma factor [Planctomycetota bacterium]
MENDLRPKLLRTLPPGGKVTATSILGEALRIAAVRQKDLKKNLFSMKAFLHKTALWVRKDKFRKAAAKRRNPEFGSIISLGSIDPGQENPETFGILLWEAVDQLPRSQSYLLRNYYLENRSMQEISRLSGEPVHRVEKEYDQALQALGRIIGIHDH